MMPLVEWNPALSVGIESIDSEHQNLIAIINRLHHSFEKGASKKTLLEIFDELIVHTRVHFQNEEEYFEKTGYPESVTHVHEHRELLRQIHKVQSDYQKEASGPLSLDIILFLRDWLMEHIKHSDKQYSTHLKASGIR